jgi:hypothetical protein
MCFQPPSSQNKGVGTFKDFGNLPIFFKEPQGTLSKLAPQRLNEL